MLLALSPTENLTLKVMTGLKKERIVLSKLYCVVMIGLVSPTLQSCSESESATSNVQYLVTNKSTDKINRLTVFIESGEALSSKIVDSVFLTNIPENLAVRLTYDINKNPAATGIYRLVAIGSKKKWNKTFGKFSGKNDADADHSYNLEIKEDSVIVIP